MHTTSPFTATEIARLDQHDRLVAARDWRLATQARAARPRRGTTPGVAPSTPLRPAGVLRRVADVLAGGLHAPSAR